MNYTSARLTLRGLGPYSQSRQHEAPRLEGESPGDYDIRTWRSKLNVARIGGKDSVVIPAHGLHQAIIAAAKYSKRQIPGQGKATWTAKFTAGISIISDPVLHIDPALVQAVTISANADGVRGSGKRVTRRFPIIPEWQTQFEILILDPIITREIFAEILGIAGMFVGIGRFRPEKGGTNGRFVLDALDWDDNRQLSAVA